jgi:hypothetical protein
LRAARAAAEGAAAAPPSVVPPPAQPVPDDLPPSRDEEAAAREEPLAHARQVARARGQGGIRATFGPERVATALMVLVLAGIAVPVTLAGTLPAILPSPTAAPPSASAATLPPATPTPTVGPSVPPTESTAPTPSAASSFTPGILSRIRNLALSDDRLFQDQEAIQAELDKGGDARPELLKGLIRQANADAFTSAEQAGRLASIQGLGDLPLRMGDQFQAISAAARPGLDGAALNRDVQVSSATQVVAAIEGLRAMDIELRALIPS